MRIHAWSANPAAPLHVIMCKSYCCSESGPAWKCVSAWLSIHLKQKHFLAEKVWQRCRFHNCAALVTLSWEARRSSLCVILMCTAQRFCFASVTESTTVVKPTAALICKCCLDHAINTLCAACVCCTWVMTAKLLRLYS